MKKYIAYYYLLFVLLIFGAFASMAQNDYGIKILGGVAIIFAFLFLIQFVSGFTKNGKIDLLDLFELGSLVVLASILAMRVFYFRFPGVEVLFALAGIILIGVYSVKLINVWSFSGTHNRVLTFLMVSFYGSIIFYSISMTVVPFMPSIAEPAGGVGFVLLLSFIFTGLLKKQLIANDQKTSALKLVYGFNDQSVVLLTLFLIFTGYMGLTKIDILPRMYSDEFPQAYYELVKKAESGLDEPANGKYRHEEFMERYTAFIERHVEKN